MAYDFIIQRQHLIEALSRDGIHDTRLLAAIAEVPREAFLAEAYHAIAYTNQALPLHLGQTISQPLMVALMTQALRLLGPERVLEVGTGSGYQTAILSHLASHVYSIERYSQLTEQATHTLTHLGRQNVTFLVGDGSLGWPQAAPYDRILVTAAAPQIPSQLVAQLVMGGLLVIPVGTHDQQELQVVQRQAQGVHVQSLGRCVFVPLIGAEGWSES